MVTSLQAILLSLLPRGLAQGPETSHWLEESLSLKSEQGWESPHSQSALVTTVLKSDCGFSCWEFVSGTRAASPCTHTAWLHPIPSSSRALPGEGKAGPSLAPDTGAPAVGDTLPPECQARSFQGASVPEANPSTSMTRLFSPL